MSEELTTERVAELRRLEEAAKTTKCRCSSMCIQIEGCCCEKRAAEYAWTCARDEAWPALLAAATERDRLAAECEALRAVLRENATEWGRLVHAWPGDDSRRLEAMKMASMNRAALSGEIGGE